MKAFPWLLAAILAAVVAWGYLHPRTVEIPGPTPSTASMRDSARADSVRIDTVLKPVIKWLRSAPVDTMVAILRDRARRLVLLGQDTVLRPEAPDSTSDSGCLPREVLAATAARQLADSANLVAKDWEVKIERTRADSAVAALGACLTERSSAVTAYGRGFRHGAAVGGAAGFVACVVAR